MKIFKDLFFIFAMILVIGNVSATIVTDDLAQFTAQDYANLHYGDGDYINRITYYDFNDTPNVYAFIFKKTTSANQTIAQIKQTTIINYQEYAQLKQALQDLKNNNATTKAILFKEQEIRKSGRKLRGRDDYFTILIGANESQKPVIHSYTGLPYSVYQKPLVNQRLSEDVDYANLTLRNTVYFVSKIKQYFSFLEQQPDSTNVIYIVPIGSKKLKIKSQEQIQQKSTPSYPQIFTKEQSRREEYQWKVMRLLKEQTSVK